MSIIVASDLNGTLTAGSPIWAVANWVDLNQPGLQPKLYKFQLISSYLLVKIGLVDTHIWADVYLREVLDLITSPTPEMLDQIMSYVVNTELWPKRKPEPIKFLQELHHQGAEIILVSAAYQPAVKHFGAMIAPNNVSGIGTSVILMDNKLYLAEELTVADKKWELLKKMLGGKKLDYALGDSIKDLPMLEEATHPVAVSPDQDLRKVATERGWRIIQ
jgi:phosphoserine phosphatase